jgi:hypothetical protein
MLVPPLPVELVDCPARGLGDLSSASVGPQARVVVDGVVGEVRRDPLGVARVEGRVVAADVLERVDLGSSRSSLL